ncbi:MAG: ComC/BlpC family leader-containing pheromone/bacteriocin [Firmicutes bacterium]|nr:ComC/BlpC family leader-containing pheromone/bacteriocin [Candidatus Colivicinus equi]
MDQFYELTDDELEMVVGGSANETKVTISENGKVTIENAL